MNHKTAHNKPDNRTEKRRFGDLGENIACDFLKKKGFEILDRNYLRKWGEIDIVAKRGEVVRFIEVKSVHIRDGSLADVSGVTSNQPNIVTSGSYKPEDNVHPQKLKRLARTMQTYLLEKRIEGDWQLDIVTVKIDEESRKARVEIIENIII
jgi:putative endonuclease